MGSSWCDFYFWYSSKSTIVGECVSFINVDIIYCMLDTVFVVFVLLFIVFHHYFTVMLFAGGVCLYTYNFSCLTHKHALLLCLFMFLHNLQRAFRYFFSVDTIEIYLLLITLQWVADY